MGIRRGKGYRLLIAPIANHWASVHEQDPFFSPRWEPGKGCVWHKREEPKIIGIRMVPKDGIVFRRQTRIKGEE